MKQLSFGIISTILFVIFLVNQAPFESGAERLFKHPENFPYVYRRLHSSGIFDRYFGDSYSKITHLFTDPGQRFSWGMLFALVGATGIFVALAFFVFYRGLRRYESGNLFLT